MSVNWYTWDYLSYTAENLLFHSASRWTGGHYLGKTCHLAAFCHNKQCLVWAHSPKNGTHWLCYMLALVIVAKPALAYSIWPYITRKQCSRQVWFWLPVWKGLFWPFPLVEMAHIVWTTHKESMCMYLAVWFSLKLLTYKVGVDALVLIENKGPFLPYKSEHIRNFLVHLVQLAPRLYVL
jgi:hypothetical protein